MASQKTEDVAVLSTKVPQDLRRQVEQFQEKNESRSNALRRLIRRGIEDDDDDASDSFRRQIQTAAISFGVVMVLSFLTLSPAAQGLIGATGIAFISALSLVPDVQPLITNTNTDIASNTTQTEQ
jgi:hypothetical protein